MPWCGPGRGDLGRPKDHLPACGGTSRTAPGAAQGDRDRRGPVAAETAPQQQHRGVSEAITEIPAMAAPAARRACASCASSSTCLARHPRCVPTCRREALPHRQTCTPTTSTNDRARTHDPDDRTEHGERLDRGHAPQQCAFEVEPTRGDRVAHLTAPALVPQPVANLQEHQPPDRSPSASTDDPGEGRRTARTTRRTPDHQQCIDPAMGSRKESIPPNA